MAPHDRAARRRAASAVATHSGGTTTVASSSSSTAGPGSRSPGAGGPLSTCVSIRRPAEVGGARRAPRRRGHASGRHRGAATRGRGGDAQVDDLEGACRVGVAVALGVRALEQLAQLRDGRGGRALPPAARTPGPRSARPRSRRRARLRARRPRGRPAPSATAAARPACTSASDIRTVRAASRRRPAVARPSAESTPAARGHSDAPDAELLREPLRRASGPRRRTRRARSGAGRRRARPSQRAARAASPASATRTMPARGLLDVHAEPLGEPRTARSAASRSSRTPPASGASAPR